MRYRFYDLPSILTEPVGLEGLSLTFLLPSGLCEPNRRDTEVITKNPNNK